MRKIILTVSLFFFAIGLWAQNKIISLNSNNFIGSYSIAVCYTKTSHIIFPYGISYVNLGSKSIWAEKVDNVENILSLKAISANFPETNLTVLTNDGKFYSFLVGYSDNPEGLNIILKDIENKDQNPFLPVGNTANFENIRFTYPELERYAHWVLSKKRSLNNLGSFKNEIAFSLNGLYIKENAFFFHLYLKNLSNINYDIDFIKFYVRDKKIIKRTSRQEIEVLPIYLFESNLENPNTIFGMKDNHKVFVLEKFTIPDDKTLEIEVFEKKGGRQMTFTITNEDLIHARLLKFKK